MREAAVEGGGEAVSVFTHMQASRKQLGGLVGHLCWLYIRAAAMEEPPRCANPSLVRVTSAGSASAPQLPDWLEVWNASLPVAWVASSLSSDRQVGQGDRCLDENSLVLIYGELLVYCRISGLISQRNTGVASNKYSRITKERSPSMYFIDRWNYFILSYFLVYFMLLPLILLTFIGEVPSGFFYGLM